MSLKVKLINHTLNPDLICAAAAQSCYSYKGATEIFEETTDKKAKKIMEYVVDIGHHSVIEHASFTFSVEGISRVSTHQLVRHRLASYSQQSQRYVNLKKPEYVIPPLIKKNKKAREEFEASMEKAWGRYQALAKAGVPIEDARYVLPNACKTNIVVTMNARELWHFFSLRTCERAQWEIRDMAKQMLAQCKKISPILFKEAGPPCIRGPCPEGDKSCGRWNKRKKK